MLMNPSYQFNRSASPSNGDADAWTQLSPVLGSDARPYALHSRNSMLRREPSGALAGSVGPSTMDD